MNSLSLSFLSIWILNATKPNDRMTRVWQMMNYSSTSFKRVNRLYIRSTRNKLGRPVLKRVRSFKSGRNIYRWMCKHYELLHAGNIMSSFKTSTAHSICSKNRDNKKVIIVGHNCRQSIHSRESILKLLSH